MKRVCVFSGSSSGARPEYLEASRQLGRQIAARRLELVYGGASVGLMGTLADAVLEAGGHVIGVIPGGLFEKEVAHEGLQDLRVVRSMHERKAQMADLSDAFVALPGGIGTLEELLEILTWSHLGIHGKPCGLLNVCGYYRGLVQFLDHAIEEGFLPRSFPSTLLIEDDAGRLLDRFSRYHAPDRGHWLGRDET